jgi:hypothetical protein
MKSRDFETMVPEAIYPHTEEANDCPAVRNWPDDEFSRWVVSNREELMNLVCESSHYKYTAVCVS